MTSSISDKSDALLLITNDEVTKFKDLKIYSSVKLNGTNYQLVTYNDAKNCSGLLTSTLKLVTSLLNPNPTLINNFKKSNIFPVSLIDNIIYFDLEIGRMCISSTDLQRSVSLNKTQPQIIVYDSYSLDDSVNFIKNTANRTQIISSNTDILTLLKKSITISDIFDTYYDFYLNRATLFIMGAIETKDSTLFALYKQILNTIDKTNPDNLLKTDIINKIPKYKSITKLSDFEKLL